MLKKENFELIGTLGRSHGLAGEVSARLSVDLSSVWHDEGDRLLLMLEEDGLLIPYRVEGLRSKSGDIDIIKFVGIDSKETAERLGNTSVWLDREYLSDEGADDAFEFAHLEGYTLLNAASSEAVGRIIAVDETTINTLLVVETGQGDEVFVPIADELLAGIDPESKVVALHIPPGLLDDSAEYDIH